LTKHNFDKTLYSWSSCIWIGNHHLRFRESAKQLKTNEYIGVRPEEIEVFGYKAV
jgi:hypothetical protein